MYLRNSTKFDTYETGYFLKLTLKKGGKIINKEKNQKKQF